MQVSDECIHMYNAIQKGQHYRWVTFKLNDEGTEIVVDRYGDSDSTFSSFMGSVPAQDTRWCLFDLQFRTLSTTRSKLIFVTWVPDSITRGTLKEAARVKTNGVLWTGTMKKLMPGVVCMLQANDVSDVAWESMLARACRHEKDPIEIDWRPEQDIVV
eukprot:TRINITY_DN7068_c0_g2_i3.p1 TRINITY_DN7068_c0_g2~~TRINITY_DN7068_c0_g2_i3.p1  ORF type:complete len:158 (+),score=23.25 TRINITY_DN7068_c0_g2_i3:104-577(+)